MGEIGLFTHFWGRLYPVSTWSHEPLPGVLVHGIFILHLNLAFSTISSSQLIKGIPSREAI